MEFDSVFLELFYLSGVHNFLHMSSLLYWIIGYLIISVAIGLYASRRVQTDTDYILAGRGLPLYIVIATTFATWFGSETVLGTSSTFVEE